MSDKEVVSTKKCSRCQEEKPLEEFRPWKSAKKGLRSECRACYNAYRNSYYHKNAEYRKRMSDYARGRRFRLRMEVLSHYCGGQPKCQCCGVTEYEWLAIDHVHNNGKEDRKKGLASKTLYQWLKTNNYPEGYQVLCHNCNFSKGAYGMCPCQKKRAAEAAQEIKDKTGG